ncbi:MAG: hypothetical protein WC655_08935 [Candidatus Hydrogenedentales bacterium]|jgi:hypothetical protein
MKPALTWIAWASAIVIASWAAHAHESLEQYVQHVAVLSVSPDNIDLTLEISFNAHDSLDERRTMDANNDGAIDSDEKNAYLKRVLEKAEKSLSLSVAGKDVRLVPLYDPELDMYDSQDLEEHPHLLRLFLFARTPKSFKAGSEIALEDRLWDSKPAMLQACVRSRDGIELVSTQSGSALRASEAETQNRVVEWKCTAIREEHVPVNRYVKGEKP